MYRKKSLSVLIAFCGILTFSAFAENETLFSEDEKMDNPIISESSDNGLSEVDSNDFYIEPKPLIKGSNTSSGFAQKNTAAIPEAYIGGGYIEMLNNEIMRLQDLPLSEELYSKGRVLPTLREGDKGENVKILMSGLISNGFLSEEAANQNINNIYNYDITKAVKDAQDYYGITVDGISGKEVYRNLFVPKEERIREIKEWQLKVDEMVEIGRKEMKPYIVIVNIPSYTLHVIETNNKTEVLQSKVVVGRSSSQTPIGRSNMVGLKYNPTWTPPMSHIKKAVIPNMKIPNGMYVVDSRGNKISHENVTTDGLLFGRYSVQQPAGANNALGLLKFETDSTDSIYLHDTNHRAFFDRKGRALSMGCVRVQQWPELAALLANSDKNYIFDNVNKGRTYIQKIESIPVFYTYSLVDNVEGKVGYYNDVYSRLN